MQPTDWIGAIGGAVGVFVALGALIVAARANARSSEANLIAARAVEMEARIDERQREFRSVDWSARVTEGADSDSFVFELRNDGDTDACSATVVLRLYPHETHAVGDVPAKGSVSLTSERLDEWMRGAIEHEMVQPGFRIHWSSPLGHPSEETVSAKSVGDFIDWDDSPF